MDQTSGRNQNDHPQERPSGGGGKTLGNIISRRIVKQAVIGVFRTFLMSPWALPFVAAIGLILLFTITIVAGIGVPPLDSDSQTTNATTSTESVAPLATPTEGPTPTLAEP